MNIDGSEYVRSPRDHPLEYPGRTPPWSFLFTGEEIHPLRRGEGTTLTALVLDGAQGREPLDQALARLGAAPVAARTPVLAYGSNASPGQLRSKFGELEDGHRVIPVLRCELKGWRTAFAARIAKYGSVPSTIVPDRSSFTTMWINLLDDAQLEVMDASERPAYQCEELRGASLLRYLDLPIFASHVRAYVAPVALDLDGDGIADPFDPTGQRRVLDVVASRLAELGTWDLRSADDVAKAGGAGTLSSDEASARIAERFGVTDG